MSLLLLSSTLFLFIHISSSLPTCHDTSCGLFGPNIKFPFGLTGSFCNFPSFNLSCNSQHQTILTLKNTPGFFNVQTIFYHNQSLIIRDPNNCLPKRFLNRSFSLNNSPFYPEFLRTFTFLSCPSYPENFSDARLVPCMSNENETVVAILDGPLTDVMVQSERVCEVIERHVYFPVAWRRGDAETRLSWSEPNCGSCERKGGSCGFEGDPSGLRVGCSGLPKTGLPRSAKYGIIIGVGIPGLLCIIGMSCYLCGRIRDYRRQNQPTRDFNSTIVPHRSIVLSGFDGPTIESFPKTQLGNSRRLPKPNDTTCPICLSEYQPKETLRTIPACNHYFHADCVDEWLKLNASCPLCRNSPDGSSVMTTPSSSSLSSASSLSAR